MNADKIRTNVNQEGHVTRSAVRTLTHATPRRPSAQKDDHLQSEWYHKTEARRIGAQEDATRAQPHGFPQAAAKAKDPNAATIIEEAIGKPGELLKKDEEPALKPKPSTELPKKAPPIKKPPTHLKANPARRPTGEAPLSRRG